MATVCVAAACQEHVPFFRGNFRKIPRVERRCALDVGSGNTKMLVTDVDVEGRRCVRQVLARERPVLYGADSKRSETGALSAEVQDQGLRVLADLLAEARELQAVTVVAVATEVFRRAPNGAEFVARIQRELGLCVQVVDQSVEALLGFRTAGAVSGVPHQELVMWDCGGGSFQLVRSCEQKMDMHLGRFGDSVATALLMELQGKSLKGSSSPNAVSAEDAAALVAELLRRLPTAPQWLKGSQGVVSVGGRNSMFFLLADMIHQGVVDFRLGEVQVDQDGCPESAQLTVEAARAALKTVLNRSDAELARDWCWRPNSDPAAMVVPKLCLIIASMESFGIESFRWCRTVGNCAGIATSDAAELETPAQ